MPSLEEMFDMLTSWVEKNEAPNSIHATQWMGRLADRYVFIPGSQKYDGSGDVNSASSYIC
jgi:hypothetical protein